MEMRMKKYNGEIVSEGKTYRWYIRHYGGISDNMYGKPHGISVEVLLDDTNGRSLQIEFPYNLYFFKSDPNRKELEDRILKSIVEAIDSGWNPDKRGKPFVYCWGDEIGLK